MSSHPMDQMRALPLLARPNSTLISTSEGQVPVGPKKKTSAIALYPGNITSSTAVAEGRLGPTTPKKRCAKRDCKTKHCSCSCHSIVAIGQRFWAFKYSPLASYRQTCNNESCNARTSQYEFKLALSQLGIRWSVAIQLYITAESGSFSLRPGLTMERIVPYTSPGFEILWKTQHHLITLEEARNDLILLFRSDPSFKTHVDPSGTSYIEVRLSKNIW